MNDGASIYNWIGLSFHTVNRPNGEPPCYLELVSLSSSKMSSIGLYVQELNMLIIRVCLILYRSIQVFTITKGTTLLIYSVDSH